MESNKMRTVRSKEEEIEEIGKFIEHRIEYGLKEGKKEIIQENKENLLYGLKYNIPSTVILSYARMYNILPISDVEKLAEYIGKEMESGKKLADHSRRE